MQLFRFLLLLIACATVEIQPNVSHIMHEGLLKNSLSGNSCLTEVEWNELGMDAVVAKLDRTRTGLGVFGLKSLLLPSNDPSLIEQQQRKLRALEQDPQLCARINELLATIAEHQDDLFSYMESIQVPESDKRLYFSLLPSFLNDYKRALDCSFIVDCSKAVLGLVSLLMFRGVSESIDSSMYELKPKEYNLSEHMAQFIGQKQQKGHVKLDDLAAFVKQEEVRFATACEKEFARQVEAQEKFDCLQALIASRSLHGHNSLSINDLAKHSESHNDLEESLLPLIGKGIIKGLMSPFRDHNPSTALFKNHDVEQLYKESLQGGTMSKIRCASKITMTDATLGDRYYFWNELMGLPKPLSALFSCATTIGHDVALFLQARGYYNELKQSLEKTHAITQKVRSCAIFIHAAREVALLLKNHPDFESWHVTTQLLELYGPENISIELHRLLNVLEECRLQPEHVYSPGSMLLAHRWLHAYSRQLGPILASVAQVDALASVSQVMRESDDTNPWCFAHCVQSHVPFINAEDFWCLLLKGQPVLNSLACKDGATKLVITGPNGGGKSTIMKSIAFNVICAQSLGIACARSWEQSIFDRLITSLDPHEDIARGLSSYMAQKQRMNQLQEQLVQRDAIQLVLIDEPYRGTVQKTSEELLYDFCVNIADASAIVLLATHFERPTVAAQAMPYSFANYQCLFSQDDHNGLVRTYKFVPGIAQWWFHDDHMRSLYLQSLEKEIAQA